MPDVTTWAADLVRPFGARRASVPLQIVERTPCDGYIRVRVRLQVFEGMPFHAYLLEPAGGGAHPGVLAVHGHGYGSRQICGMAPDGSPDTTRDDGHHHFAEQLVRRGFTVIAPDVLGYGERISAEDRAFDPGTTTDCYRLAATMLLRGETLSGLRVVELLGVIDQLGSHPAVRPGSLGIVGHSGGSQLALLTALLDPRIGATVLCSWTNTFAASIETVRHCLCNYLPGVLDVGEQPELIAALAPRSLFVESGRKDPIFPVAGFEQAVAHLRPRWHGDAFGHDLHDGGHEVSGVRAFAWLARMMGP